MKLRGGRRVERELIAGDTIEVIDELAEQLFVDCGIARCIRFKALQRMTVRVFVPTGWRVFVNPRPRL